MEITEYAEYADIKRRFEEEVELLREQKEQKDKELRRIYDGIKVRLNQHVHVIQSVFSKIWGLDRWNLVKIVPASSDWCWALSWDWKIVGLDEKNIIVQLGTGKVRVNGREIPKQIRVPMSILSMSDRQVAYLARTDAWRAKANIAVDEEKETKSSRKNTKSQIRSLEKKLAQLEKDVTRLEEKTSGYNEYLKNRAARTFEVRRKEREATATTDSKKKAGDAL